MYIYIQQLILCVSIVPYILFLNNIPLYLHYTIYIFTYLFELFPGFYVTSKAAMNIPV